MKSSTLQLESRGYVSDESLTGYRNLTDNDLKRLLHSSTAVERTAAAKLSGERRIPEMLPLLCRQLESETSLYTRIALCDSIVKYGISSIGFLIPLIGKIGKNRHTRPVLVDLNKKSFPLPRDITARIIIRIGCEALPYLEDILLNGEAHQKYETADAIGHIAFYFNDYRSEGILLKTYYSSDDVLLQWKLIRAFQSFKSNTVISLLENAACSSDRIISAEAVRSIERIKKRNLIQKPV